MAAFAHVTATTISVALLIAAAPATKQSSSPATTTKPSATTRGGATTLPRRGSADPGAAAVRAAVLALTKEYEQYLRNAANASVREESNYFKDHPDAAVTPEAIAAALQSRGGDPRTSAYVKWQLLSGLPTAGDQLDPAAARQLLAAYRVAPQPYVRPGVAVHEQQKLDVYVQGKKPSDEADIKAYLDTAVSQVARQNRPILNYRDELYRRLPRTPETFAAAMDDLVQRLSAVAEDKDLLKQFVADVREWATLEPRPPHVVNALARAARKLADSKGPQYYQSPYWHSSNVMAWRKTRGSVDSASALKDLAVYLEEQAAQPALELKEKKN
jgi:hypothetical protein